MRYPKLPAGHHKQQLLLSICSSWSMHDETVALLTWSHHVAPPPTTKSTEDQVLWMTLVMHNLRIVLSLCCSFFICIFAIIDSWQGFSKCVAKCVIFGRLLTYQKSMVLTCSYTGWNMFGWFAQKGTVVIQIMQLIMMGICMYGKCRMLQTWLQRE